MNKPPMQCQNCNASYNIEPDEVRCVCGQQLFRVMIGPDGQLTGPPSMPEHIRRQMQHAWEQNRELFTEPQQQGDGYREIGVRPSNRFTLQPDQVARDAAAAFGREAERSSRGEFYASWSAYDAALQGMSPMQQNVQRKAEILDLERQFGL